jgi:hypothetical protein
LVILQNFLTSGIQKQYLRIDTVYFKFTKPNIHISTQKFHRTKQSSTDAAQKADKIPRLTCKCSPNRLLSPAGLKSSTGGHNLAVIRLLTDLPPIAMSALSQMAGDLMAI